MGRDKRSAGAPSSSAGAGGEQAAGADGSLARSDCAVCKKEVAVGSEDHITGVGCNRKRPGKDSTWADVPSVGAASSH